MSAPAVTNAMASGRTWLGLFVLQLPVLLVSMDFSVLYLAAPTITDALNPSATQQLWILDIYGFLIAGLLITMGNIGDRIGRRRILLAGAAVFGIASVLAAFAPNPEMLIAARALMGVGGATLMPATLSLIANMFPDPTERARAIGIWTAAFAGGAAIGPVVGGVLLHHFWWGVVFLINVPVLAVLFITAPLLLPEFRARNTAPFDVVGVVLSLLGILPLVYAVKLLATEGPAPTSIISGLFGVTMLVLFVLHERRIPAPLLPLNLFANPAFCTSLAIALFGMMSQGGMAYLTNIYLQSVLGHDVLTAALASIPMAITIALFSVAAAGLSRRLGLRITLTGAVGLTAVSIASLATLTPTSPLWVFMVATAFAGVGFGLQFSMVTDVVVSSAPPAQSGAASGVSETSFELGTALGLALFGSLATAVFLSRDEGQGFADSLGATLHRVGTSGPIADAARAAFVDGLHAAALTGGALLAITATVAFLVIRGKPTAAASHDSDGLTTEAAPH